MGVTSVTTGTTRRQGNSLASDDDGQDNNLVLLRHALRSAIEESGEKKEAVAAAMGLGPEYLSKLFSGEKSITARHLVGLPDRVERIFARRYAELKGLIVVEPVAGADAIHQLVNGLVGVLTPMVAKGTAQCSNS